MQKEDIPYLEEQLKISKDVKLNLQKEKADATDITIIVNILKLLVSDLKTKASSENFKFEPTTVVNTIRTYIEGAETSLKYVKDINSIYKLKLEINYLNTLIPKQLTNEIITEIIDGILDENPKAKIGDIMSYFKNNYAGQYDGKYLSGFVNKYLSK